MGAIQINQTGSFDNILKWLRRAQSQDYLRGLDGVAKRGVDALRAATPRDTGELASKWGYKIIRTPTSTSIVWTNDDQPNGVPIAVILNYGHGTKNGGYVQGRNYINPAIQPIFDQVAREAWRLLTR
jgi:hypothetical protein